MKRMELLLICWVAVSAVSLAADPNFVTQPDSFYSTAYLGLADPVPNYLTLTSNDGAAINWEVDSEPFPNGGIINMGAYGGTSEASKSYFGDPVCLTPYAGDINGDCRIDLVDFSFFAEHWLENHQVEQVR